MSLEGVSPSCVLDARELSGLLIAPRLLLPLCHPSASLGAASPASIASDQRSATINNDLYSRILLDRKKAFTRKYRQIQLGVLNVGWFHTFDSIENCLIGLEFYVCSNQIPFR